MDIIKDFWQKIRKPGWTKEAQKIITDLQKVELSNLDKFIDALNYPVIQIAGSNLPFVSLGLTALRIYLGATNKPSLNNIVIIGCQMAYLESLKEISSQLETEKEKQLLNQNAVGYLLEKQLDKLKTIKLEARELKETIACFSKSKLAKIFEKALTEELETVSKSDPAIDYSEFTIKKLIKRVTWGTYEHIIFPESLGEEINSLAAIYSSNTADLVTKFDKIREHLNKIIKLPEEKIFSETEISYRDLYVQLKIQFLKENGAPKEEIPVNIHQAIAEILLNCQAKREVIFIQGDAGRGKSLFCRMFAAEVASFWYPLLIPILIRLRDIKVLENNLTQTLETHLENCRIVEQDWLKEDNRRYLLIFDGLDELALQNRRSEGVEQLLQQIASFQKDSHHQCIITGRPLVLQGINLDRIITQTKNLKRVKIELMSDILRKEWLEKWAKKVGQAEKEEFYKFLQQCPEAVNNLAREPLLLYLLATMHRERRLSIQKFAEKSATETKIEIYSESIKWVLEKQRENLNFRITGLETENLRQFLREAALCVVQLENETAPLNAIAVRLEDDYKPIKELIQKAIEETKTDEKKALNNLLTCFYIKPGEKDPSGSIEFTHKSFGEFLFAEKLTESL